MNKLFIKGKATTTFLYFFPSNEPGETRLGLMWTCMTLYNRPQVCFTPELQIEWLLALICIFCGCICITTTIILLASSNWDRNVIPYARWVGFTASRFFYFLNVFLYWFLICCSSGSFLLGCCNISPWISCWWNWRSTLSASKFSSSWYFLYYVCFSPLDYCDIGIICTKSMSSTFLSYF